MSFTRYHDDKVRIQKQLMISTNSGRYALTTPGPGINLPFISDPHIRLEKWGANYLNNGISIENDLRGLTRRTGHDGINTNNYLKYSANISKNTYPTNNNVFVEESRAILPPFIFRESEMYRWEEPFLDPQKNIEIPFNYEMQSRIIEKDKYTDKYLSNINKNN